MPQDQKIVKDERGQEQPADKKRAQTNQNTAKEGGGAYAPQHDEASKKGDERTPDKPIGVTYANRDLAKKKTGEF